ncbi:MAG TPA: UDP-3-O-acyl-N-acetylglucosamine deacetylase [Caulobacteraceae bacterium]|nr:UDP-3-O-acyl-N-acetylglucosamine deacetylase [Caulobacteraceae bacterium]
MSLTRQTTLAAPAHLAGVGIHNGLPVNLAVLQAPADSGIIFARTDVEGEARAIPALADRVCDTRLATVIGNESGTTVSTVEHLMAAFAGLGIDNARVELDGPEMPILDGSAADFVAALDAAGRTELDAPRRCIEILEPIVVDGPGKRAALVPADRFELAVEIIFDAPAIGRQRLDLAVDPDSFRAEIAPARTFGFIAEVEQLRAMGLGRGASLENTIVVDGDKVLNPEILQRPDDFVRHKALDALGDLALAGHPIRGRYEASCSGHALNNQLVRALMARPGAWRMVTTP